MYDTVEYLIGNENVARYKIPLSNALNEVFAKHRAAYRLIDGLVVDITSEQEIDSIQNALDSPDKFAPVSEHLAKALRLMSDRQVN